MAAKKTSKAGGSATTTIDHDEIREWVESHGGHPAMVKSTTRNGRGGILRIDFPGFSGERTLKEVSWDEFFDKFEESQLAFMYQEQTSSGRPSRFNKLVGRASVLNGGSDGARAQPRRKKTTPRAAAARTATKKRPAKRAKATQARSTASRSTARAGSGARGAGRMAKKKARPSKTKRAVSRVAE